MTKNEIIQTDVHNYSIITLSSRDSVSMSSNTKDYVERKKLKWKYIVSKNTPSSIPECKNWK